MKGFVMYLWQLPQNLLGVLLFWVYRPKEIYDTEGLVIGVAPKFKGGISLGRYILMSRYDVRTIRHEMGHCEQSKRLGWLYLMAVGLPSITHAIMCSMWHHCPNGNYYHFWTEKWANNLMDKKKWEK